MDETTTERARILGEAIALIDGDRQADYGPPAENFQNIATGWSILLGVEVTAPQVALCMAWLKMARAKAGYKRDTAVDLAGYAGLYGELSEGVPADRGVANPPKPGGVKFPEGASVPRPDRMKISRG